MLRSLTVLLAWTVVLPAALRGEGPKEQGQAGLVIAFGDSTTAERDGATVYSQLLAEAGITVANVGLPNHTTEMARAVLARQVLARRPRLVVIQFGINDAAVDVWKKKDPPTKPRVSLARYEENLRYFVRTLKEQGSEVILMTPNPLCWTAHTRQRFGKPPYDPTSPDGLNVVLKQFVEVVRRLAGEEKVPLIDVFAAYRQPGRTAAELLSDGVHPNSAGHRLVADLLLPEVRRRLK